jgi:hypothetical protein
MACGTVSMTLETCFGLFPLSFIQGLLLPSPLALSSVFFWEFWEAPAGEVPLILSSGVWLCGLRPPLPLRFYPTLLAMSVHVTWVK